MNILLCIPYVYSYWKERKSMEYGHYQIRYEKAVCMVRVVIYRLYFTSSLIPDILLSFQYKGNGHKWSHNRGVPTFFTHPRAYRPQRGRGHVTAIVSCVPSKIQTRQWFVTNCSNSCTLAFTMHTEEFSLHMNFARCMPSSPLGVYKPLTQLMTVSHVLSYY